MNNKRSKQHPFGYVRRNKKYSLYQILGREHNMHHDKEIGDDKNTQIEDTRKDWYSTVQTTPSLHRKSTTGGPQANRIWYRK